MKTTTANRIDVDLVLTPDVATIMFGRRLRFQALLRRMADDGRGHVIDLSEEAAAAESPGTLAVLAHARELRLGGGPCRSSP